MNEEKSSKNQEESKEQVSGSSWEFFIAQEEMSQQLNGRTPHENQNCTDPDKERSWILRFFSETKATDWAIVFLTAGLVLVGYWQWQAISGQLREMKASGKQTDQLLHLYQQQVGELEGSVGQQRALVEKAQATLDTTKSQFRADQRPYVWLQGPPPHTPIGVIGKDENDFFWNVFYTNYGKSPAINLCHKAFLLTGENALDKVVDINRNTCGTDHVPKHGSILPPMRPEWTSAPLGRPATDQEIKQWESTQYGIVVYGRFDYRDGFGNWYFSQFCMARQKNGAVANCEQHNRIQ